VRFDTGAGRRVPVRHPCVPHFVHQGEVVVDVAKEDLRREQMLAVGTRLTERSVHPGEGRPGLGLDVCVGIFGDLAGEVDDSVVGDDLAGSLGHLLA